MKTIADIYNNIEKDITKRIESSSEVANTINALNPEELKEFRSRVFDEYLARPENHIIDTQNPSKTRRLEFSEIEPFLSGEKPQETQGFFSRAGDDLSNIGKAWNAGNFYSEGGWNNLAKNIINGGTPQEREELFQNYLKWESKNQMPENKTWVGDVVNGVANLVPLTVDMLPEAAAVGAATGAAGAGIGSIVPGLGTVAGGIGGFKGGLTASMVEQSYKVGIADIYTSLRKDGVDDETAKTWAIWAGIPYGALEFAGKGIAPIQRKFLGGKVLKELIDKVSDAKIKNKILNTAAKYGADVALTGTLEAATEGGQGGITEFARQGAKGEDFDVGKVASATWDEAAQAAPAMYGMAALGIPLEAATNRREKQLQQVRNAVEEGRKSATEEGTPAPIKKPTSAPNGGIDVGGLSNLEADAANDEIDLQNTAQKKLENPDGKKETSAQSGLDRAQAAALFMQNLQNDPMNVPQGLGLQQEEALLEFMKMRAKLATVQAEKARAEQAKAQEEARLDELAEESLTEAQFERAKENTAKKLADLKPKTNRVAARIERITDPAQRLTAIKEAYEQGNLEKLTDGQLESAWENGADWAEKELSRRTESKNSGTPLLQVMKENGFKLPTPAAIKRHAQANGRGLSSYTFGEINDLYNSLPANQRLRYFTKNYVNLDETAESLKKFGFKYDSEGDFISDVADNLSGQRLSYGFSLAENDFGKMTDAELVEAHRKAEAAKDYSAGFEIKKEWDKRRGYNRDLYHGSPNKNITEFRDESYFTEDKNYARRYKKGEDGRIYEVRANLKKPFDTRNPKEREIFEKEFYGKWGNGTPLGERGLPDWTDGSDLWEFLQEKGYDYDSMVLDEGGDGGYGDTVKWRGESYVPMKSSAVKLRDAFTYGDDGKYIPLDKRSDAGNPDIRYSIGEGDYFNKARNELPVDKDSKPNLLDVSGTDAELFQRAEKTFESMPMFTRAADGVKIKLKVSEGGSMAARVVHMISNNSTGQIAPHKLAWLPNIQGTIENAQVRLKGRYDIRKQEKREPNRIYIRRYGDGTIHAVVVSPYGEIVGQDIKSANVITQYPVERIGEIYNAKVDWVNPKMTEAPISKTEASHIKDLSHQGTVPLPKANGSTSKGSTISDSRRLSMSEESETSRESQAKIDEIKTAVEEVLEKFNRKAKIKSDVSVVGTLDEARAELGAESIPYNARAVQSGDKVVIIAENITDTDEAVRIFLHEQVGHWGLHKFLKADFSPFLNYVILNYKGSEAWNRIAKYYGNVASDKYVIAEEMLAHIAENRELSDPSMWKRLVHKVKRELWGNGVPQEYVNLLNEDVLRSAIALSREWAKGDHYLNANGIWAKIESAPKGRDIPDDKKQGRLSLKEQPTDAEIKEAQRQKDEVKAKWTNPDGTMKKGYHLAPNGKESKLTEEQWLWVRTPNFKKWFGDWEKQAYANAAMDFLENTAPVKKLSGGEFQKDGVKLTEKVPAFFKSINNVAHNEELGDVVLDLKGVEDSVAHGVGRLKSAAFMAVPEVIEKGFIFNRERNWKERGWDTAVIVAPVKIGEEDYVCEVVVKKVRGQQRFYLHEVEIKKTLDGVFKSVANSGNASQVSKLIIGKHLAEVKGNVSQVVDENGEPLVVYHGSTAMFNEFRSEYIGRSTGTADGRGFYFTTDKSYAKAFKAQDGRVIEAFLNIRDTLDHRKKTIKKAALKKIIKEIDRAEFEADGGHYFISNFDNYLDKGIDKTIDTATESNYDFCDTDVEILNVLVNSGVDFDSTAKAIKDITGKDGEIVPKDNNTTHFIVFNSNQIKDAVGNVGTFSENPDIRYSIREEDEWATNKKEWDNISFARQVDSYAKGDYPSGKFFTVGTPSALLKSFGIPDNKIVMTEGVLKKIKTHGLSDVQIKQIPEAINSPVGIFSYPKNKNVFDVLVEMHMDDGRPIIVSLEINKNRQGLGEITDLLTAHPKENFGRIVDWAKKGRCKYWNKQKGRKLLQDTIPADWERYETELTPYLPLQSEINDERQGKYSLKEKTPEKYDGRFGDANRKYTRLLGQKRRELGREIPYEELPNVATDEEFEKAVGMSKQAFGDLMKERDKMGADMAYEYQKTDQRAKQATVDRFNPIKVVEMFINGGEAFGAEKSAYKSLLAAGNMDAVMYNAIYVGLPKYNRKKGQWEVREGTKPLIAYFDKVKGDKYDNFENYANAVAMLEHYKREHKLETISDAYKWADDKEFEAMSGFTKQQAKKWMEEATKDSKDTVKALQEFFAANREFMVETGLASRAQADVLNSFEYYLPMLREFDENDSIMSGDGSGYRSRGFSGRSSGVKNFTGSRRKTKNVMESIIERTAALYANGYKNIAMQRSIQMLSEFGLARHAEKSSEIVKARISCAKAALEKAGVQVGEVHDESELIPLEAFHITNSLDERIRDNIVSVRANGRLIFYKINDPELLVALKSLGQEQMNVLTQWLIGAKNVMTWGVTKLPAFAIRNFLRDTGANSVLLGNNPIKSVANFVKALKDTSQMQNIRMSGFGGAVWYPVSAKGVSTDFGGGAWKKTKRVGKYLLKPFEAYERVLQASEQANRITAYDRAIADGVSEAEAAYRANDVLPFNMRGSGVWTGKNNYAKSGIQILSWLIRVSPFVNAGIQGLFKAYREMGIERGMFNAKDEFAKRAKMRELAKSLNKGLMARGALLAALSVAYSIYTNSSTDDDGEKWYEKLPDDDKLNYWHFYTGNNTILRLPKPFEIGYLFSTIPTAMADAFLSENPDTAKILFKGLVDQMRFDLTSNPAINTVKENLRNKTSFRGSPVVERSDLNLPPQMQYSADTSATAKALSIIPSMLPLLKDSWAASPARVQNALNNFFGGMSQYGTYATDAILQSFTDIEQPTSRYARISPITRAYDWATRDTKTMRVKNSEVFYELKNRVDELYAAARMYRQTGQLERLDALMDTHKSEFGNYELINALNTQLREIATKRRKLGETKSYSTAELIELDNKLLAERNQLLQKVDTIIERIERGEYRPRDLREVTKRIDRSAAVKKDSQKARMLMRQLE